MIPCSNILFDNSSLLHSFPRDSIWLAMHMARETVGTLTEAFTLHGYTEIHVSGIFLSSTWKRRPAIIGL